MNGKHHLKSVFIISYTPHRVRVPSSRVRVYEGLKICTLTLTLANPCQSLTEMDVHLLYALVFDCPGSVWGYYMLNHPAKCSTSS
jgi:hypothetical protein